MVWTLLWIVESVAVDTDGREAALKPETRANKLLTTEECATDEADASELG